MTSSLSDQEMKTAQEGFKNVTQSWGQVRKNKRKVKVDSKKNQKEMFQACEHKNTENLERLIELGCTLEVFNPYPSGHQGTLLNTCLRQGWVEGVELLLDEGYKELNVSENPFVDLKKEQGGSSLENAIRFGTGSSLAIAEMIWSDYPEPHQNECLKAIRSPNAYNFALKMNKTHLIDPKNLKAILESTVYGFRYKMGSSDPQAELQQKVFRSILELYPEQKSEAFVEKVWLMACTSESPLLMQSLAQMELFPQGMTIHFAPSTHISSYAQMDGTYPAEWLVKDQNRHYGNHTYYQPAPHTKVPRKMSLAAVALCAFRNSSKCVQAILSIPSMAKMLWENPEEKKLLHHVLDPVVFNTLKEQGYDLDSLKDSTGATPLHNFIKRTNQYHFSLSRLEELARANLNWIDAVDNDGKHACEYIKSKEQRAKVDLKFDQMAIKSVVKLGRVKGGKAAKLKENEKRRI